ncbi:MAG: DUF1778 domain-containing protein [Xanthomonadales bacterium]|nr:DUF1778 domain-containing protein [Xanthomonadales bacterium]
MEAARRAAEEALLDRTIVTVSAEIHAQSLARLDQAPPDNPPLRRTLTTPLPWSA